MWFSVDPLFEKYPNVSSYAYTFNNPVKFIDPTGMKGEDIIIKGKDNHSWTIKAHGEDRTINVPVALGSDRNIDLGIGDVDPNRFVVGYSVNAGLEGSVGLGVSGNINLTIAQFTDPTYAGYNYVYSGAEQGATAGAQLSISASVGAGVFVGYNNSEDLIRPQDFSGNSYAMGLSADIKAVVGGGEATNLGSAGASRGYTYLLNDVKPTSQRGMLDRVTNRISPIPSALGNYGIRKAQKLLR